VIKPVEVSTVLKGLVSIGLNFNLHLLIVATQYSVVALSQISRTLMHSGANHHCYLATSCQNQYFDQKEKKHPNVPNSKVHSTSTTGFSRNITMKYENAEHM